MNDEIKLGMEAKDKVTGFTGIITARIHFLNGCVQFGIRPKAKDGNKVEDSLFVDWQQIEILGPGVSDTAPLNAPGGPPMAEARAEYHG